MAKTCSEHLMCSIPAQIVVLMETDPMVRIKWCTPQIWVYQNSTAKLRESIPHIERQGYDNMGLEIYGYRVVRACIY
jgi:hypothetical protein